MLTKGEVVGGYTVGDVLGEGGFAWVYAGVHVALGHKVAIKVLLPHYVAKDAIRARFLDEARLQANLTHAHIIKVLDIIAEPGVAAMVLEHADGGTLADLLDDTAGPLPVADVRRLGEQLLSALTHAHRADVIHRDVKPANLLLRSQRPLVALLGDFGIARVRGDLRGRKASTAAGSTLGTIAYASPEQLTDPRSVDARSDVWSAAVLLLEAATGVHPFDGGTDLSTMQAITEARPDIPEGLRRDEPALVAAIEGALKLSPGDRWSSAEQFATELARTTPPPPGPASATRPASPPLGAQSPPPASADTFTLTPATHGAFKWLALMVGVVIAGALLTLALRPPTLGPPPPPPAPKQSTAPTPPTQAQQQANQNGPTGQKAMRQQPPARPTLDPGPGSAAFPASGGGATLLVATGNDFAPFYSFSNGRPVGFDVDLARELGRRLGKRDVKFLPGTGVRARVGVGSADLGLAAISITAARRRETLFSTPYQDSRFVVVSRGAMTRDELRGSVCSVWSSHKLYRGLLAKTGCRLDLRESHDEALDAVREGDATFTVTDEAFVRSLAEPLRGTDVALGSDTFGVAMQLGNQPLKTAVDAALVAMEQDGTLRQLQRKHSL